MTAIIAPLMCVRQYRFTSSRETVMKPVLVLVVYALLASPVLAQSHDHGAVRHNSLCTPTDVER